MIGLINASGRKFSSMLTKVVVGPPLDGQSLPQTSLPGQKLVGETSAGTIQRLPHHPYTNFLEEDNE